MWPSLLRVSVFVTGFGVSGGFGEVAFALQEVTAPTEVENVPLEASDVSEAEEFGGYDIAELQRIKVTSVGKKPETLSTAPAAIFVITPEDIRRSGVTSLPEALRMAPGVNVARIDAGRYAISARGFNDRFSNKLLVLMDGRAIYTPAFGGVFWEKQDTVLEDIERIEIIRGSGGTLWGANAFNGVISITSRNAADTQGWLVSSGGGTEDRAAGAVRYGGAISDSIFYRAYAKAVDRDDLGGADRSNGLRSGHTGFRVDGVLSPANQWTFQGEINRTRAGETVRIPNQTPPLFVQTLNDEVHFSGGNLQGSFTHQVGRDAEAILQLYYDRARVAFEKNGEIEIENTADVDFQHRFRLSRRHEWVWGFGYRAVQDEFKGSYSLSFAPTSRTTQVLNLFAQDTFALYPDLSLIWGSKLEHNDYTGFELQPNARLAWSPTPRQMVWAAVSRSVRNPTRLENNVSVAVNTAPGPLVIRGLGNEDVLAETLVAFEVGHRIQPLDSLSLDVAVFYNDYDNLVSSEIGAPVTTIVPPELPFTLDSKLQGFTYGGEAAARVKLTRWWSLQPAFSALRMRLKAAPDSRDSITARQTEGSNPQHQFSLRSRMSFPRRWELDGWLRYVDALPGLSIPSYVTADARVGWRPVEQLELSLTGQNLLQHSHPEFAPTIRGTLTPPEVNRGFFGKIVWRH